MSRTEFFDWVDYYRSSPFDDEHRYHRPAALIASRLGGEFDKHLEFLVPPEIPEGMSVADFNTLRAFGKDPHSEY